MKTDPPARLRLTFSDMELPGIFSWALLFLIFYCSAYLSVSPHLPSAIPVHHDDYTNYAAGGHAFVWSWSRPLSNFIIHLLARLGPEWLIWSIRLLTVTFVFLTWKLLCELAPPRDYWTTLLLFGVASFATPIVVEYARYTGMITHLLSGCLGLAAVLFLFRAASRPGNGGLPLSAAFLVSSALAKEDFVLLYAVSLLYAVLFLPVDRRKTIAWGLGGLVLSLLAIVAAKLFAAASFLGVADPASSYYINMSPGSVRKTIFSYLTGAAHPAMLSHGRVVAQVLLVATAMALVLLARRRTFPRAGYFVVAALCIIAPYSVLPNHVNAYYELVWVPMIIASVFMAFSELMQRPGTPMPEVASRVPLLVLLAVAASLSSFDFSGRRSIAAWYDNVAASNAATLTLLDARRAQIDQARHVCIEGADSFSPWFMHGGQYLGNVMGLDATWHVISDPASPSHGGMVMGANSSRGRIVVAASPESVGQPCLHLNLLAAK